MVRAGLWFKNSEAAMDQTDMLIQQADKLLIEGQAEAAQVICESVLTAANHVGARCILGNICLYQGNLDEAYRNFLSASALDPESGDAFLGLGVAAAGIRNVDRAVAYFRRALELASDNAELPELVIASLLSTDTPPGPHEMTKLGELLFRQERYHGAELFFDYAVGRQPDDELAWAKLGDSLKAQRRYAEAIACYKQALTRKPDWAEVHLCLGRTLADDHHYEDAAASYRQATTLNPHLIEAYSGLVFELIRKGRLEEAEQTTHHALCIDPDAQSALYSLAILFELQGCFDQAQRYLEQALVLHPDGDHIRLSSGVLRLKLGDLAAGFQLYEHRLTLTEQRRKFKQPKWDGSPLEGCRILVYGEQGTGDIIQFLRYLPMVKMRGGYVILEHYPTQRQLFIGACGYDELIEQRPHLLPPDIPFDVHIAIMSLARIFETRLETIPAQVPYLTVNRAKSEEWQARLADNGPELKVGIAWTGNPKHFGNLYRSCTPETFAPLTRVPGIRLYSLQVGEAVGKAAEALAEMGVIDLAPHIHDFVDTAAAIQNLDLVITVDSSPAHIAGALGRPVWTLLAFNNDWRWLLDRRDTPWYPTMRLFRQPRLGDWATVMEEVCKELYPWAEAAARGRNLSCVVSTRSAETASV